METIKVKDLLTKKMVVISSKDVTAIQNNQTGCSIYLLHDTVVHTNDKVDIIEKALGWA